MANASDEGLEALMAQVAELEEDHEVQQMQGQANAEVGARKAVAAAATVKQTSVCVSNLDPRASEQDLRTVFGGCGEIVRVTVMKDRHTQISRGFAFIEVATEDAAAKSLS